jgi:hypothetical protein
MVRPFTIHHFTIHARQGDFDFPSTLGGFPHSEIVGSKGIRTSPTLIAAYHVLHRLCMPRHPPIALKTLDRSHCQCPPRKPEGFVAPDAILKGLSSRYDTRRLPDGIGTKRPASRDQSGGAVRLTHHVREIERLTATNRIHRHPASYGRLWTFQGQAPNTEPEQIFSLRCHAEQAEGTSLPQTLYANDLSILSTPTRQSCGLRWYGGAGRDRTDDILLAKQALSQLSYGP